MSAPARGELLGALPDEARPLVARLLAAADADRLRVYLVGGPVRDWLMRRPLRDVDLCVEAREDRGAPELARSAAASPRDVRVHERFGTVTLRDGAARVDLATVRSEQYASAGALPQVAPGTLEQDLLRRDFSVNAMALPLSRAARARGADVVDVAGGRADLAAGHLRVLHARSFHDDPTRALRAARLGPRLGLAPDRGTRAALRAALRDGAFGAVSGDRLRREIVRIVDDAGLGLDPALALRLLDDWHVLPAIEPGLVFDRRAAAPLRRLGRALAKPPWSPGRSTPWVAAAGLWLAPLPAALRRRSLERLSIDGERARRIGGLARRCETRLRALARSRGRGAVDAALAGVTEEELLALYALADPATRRRVVRWADQDRQRRPPVRGEDLVAAGLEGPAIGAALQRVRSAWLDGRVRSREEALTLVEELSRRGRRRRR